MAAGLAAELKESLGLDADLIAGSKGIFDVLADDTLIFSKYAQDRFPYLGEVTTTLKEQAG